MPHIALTERRMLADAAPAPKPLPVPQLPRLLADMQTTIARGGLAIFSGDIERFVIFSLICRASMSRPDRSGAISVHSVALSLSRPFETVRRHVAALLQARLCHRTSEGVSIRPATWRRPEIVGQLHLVQNCFVRFIDDALRLDLIQPPRRAPTRSFQCADAMRAATDLMLAVYDSHRRIEAHRADIALFFAVLHVNASRYDADPAAGPAPDGRCTPFGANHAVRPGSVARMLAMSETTVRRRTQPLTGPGLPFVRTAGGLLASADWLATEGSKAALRASHDAIRLIVARIAVAGFPFAEPWTAYIGDRPDPVLAR